MPSLIIIIANPLWSVMDKCCTPPNLIFIYDEDILRVDYASNRVYAKQSEMGAKKQYVTVKHHHHHRYYQWSVAGEAANVVFLYVAATVLTGQMCTVSLHTS